MLSVVTLYLVCLGFFSSVSALSGGMLIAWVARGAQGQSWILAAFFAASALLAGLFQWLL
jgi:hypothetical protein